MIKILHSADLHIGISNFDKALRSPKQKANGSKNNIISGRFDEISKTLENLLKIAIEQDVDLVLFAGDIFHRKNPFPHEENLFAGLIKNLLKNNIEVLVLAGNHEMARIANSENSLHVFQTLAGDGFHLLGRESVTELETKSGPIQIAAIPWTRLVDGRELLGENFSGKAKEWHEYFEIVLQKLTEAIKPTTPSILVAHAFVSGTDTDNSGLMFLTGSSYIPLPLLAKTNFDYIALGHLHKYQKLPLPNTKAFYSGSLIRNSFSEEGHEKGVIIVEIDEKITKTEFKPISTVRKMISLQCDIAINDDIIKVLQFVARNKDTRNAIVKIIYQIPCELPSITQSQAQEALPDAYFISLYRNSIKAEQSQNPVIINDPIEALSEYIDNREGLKANKEALLNLAKKLSEDDK